jgi:hypothetical protein
MKSVVEQLLALYYLYADQQYLTASVQVITQEQQSPTLQETVLTLDKLTMDQVATQIVRQNALVLSTQQCTNCRLNGDTYEPTAEAVVEAGKLIRVFPADIPANLKSTECLVLSLVSISDTSLILVPPPALDIADVLPTEVSDDV